MDDKNYENLIYWLKEYDSMDVKCPKGSSKILEQVSDAIVSLRIEISWESTLQDIRNLPEVKF